MMPLMITFVTYDIFCEMITFVDQGGKTLC